MNDLSKIRVMRWKFIEGSESESEIAAAIYSSLWRRAQDCDN